jgi:hypothetical protein
LLVAQCLNQSRYKAKEKSSRNIFETRTEFFLAEMKAQSDERGGRILLGDNTRRAVTQRPIRFTVCWTFDFNWTPFLYS